MASRVLRSGWGPGSVADGRGIASDERYALGMGEHASSTQGDGDGRDPSEGAGMDPDDEVCLCFRVSLRKIRNFVRRTEPRVPSQIADCLGAGTGCRWCVPFLEKLHRQWEAGEPMGLPIAPAEYAARRSRYRRTGAREVQEAPKQVPKEDSASGDPVGK